MATTAANISYVGSMVGPDHEKLLELTTVIGERLPSLRRIALQKLNNMADAEDAVQDALLAAYTHVRQFRGQAQLSTWLTSIVINSARMRLRCRQRMQKRQNPQPGDEELFLAENVADRRPDPEEACRYLELLQVLGRSFRRLSPTLRRTLHLRTVQGLSIRETANVLKVPVGTVKAQLARSRQKLRDATRGRLAGVKAGPRESKQ